MLVALGTQHAKRMRHIAICGLTGFTICFYILINGTIFEKKKNYWTQNVFWFSIQILPATLLIIGIIQRDILKNVQ